MKIYKYRNNILIKDQELQEWTAQDVEGGYNTLDDIKNAIDKKLGGWSGRSIPGRWLKDEKLKQEYVNYVHNK